MANGLAVVRGLLSAGGGVTMSKNVPTAFDQLALAVWRQNAPVGTSVTDMAPYEVQRSPAFNAIGGLAVTYDEVNDQIVLDASGVGSGGQTNLTLSNGLNSNIATGGKRTLRVGGPSAAFSVGGFDSGGAGLSILLTNTTSQPMTIVHEDTSSTAVNRIDTQSGGASITLQPKTGAVLFLYDTTESRWIAQNVGVHRPKVYDIRDYGASTSATGATNAAAIIAALAAASVTGGTCFIPEGNFTVTPGAAIAVPLGVKLQGVRGYGNSNVLGSWLTFTAFGFALGYVFADVEHLGVQIGASAGPAFDFVNTNSPANVHFDRVDIINGNTAMPMIRVGTQAAPAFLIGAKFERCLWTHAKGATVPGVSMFGDNGTLNNLYFSRIWCQSDVTATAPFFDIEGQASVNGNSGVVNMTMKDILLEQPAAGAIKLRSVSHSTFTNIWIGDLAAHGGATGRLIDIGKDTHATYSTPSAYLLFQGVTTDSGSTGTESIFCDGSVGGQGAVTLIGCKFAQVGSAGGDCFYQINCNISAITAGSPTPQGWTGAAQIANTFTASQSVASAAEVKANTAHETIAMMALHNSTTEAAIYVGANYASPSTVNQSLELSDANSFLNGIGAGGKAGFTVGGAGWFIAYAADNEGDAVNSSAKPLVGDSARSSPYGQDGYGTQSMQAGGTVVAAAGVYKNGTIEVTGNPGGAVVLQLPLGKYRKLIINSLSGTTCTVKGPTGSATGNLNAGMNWVACDGTNFHGP